MAPMAVAVAAALGACNGGAPLAWRSDRRSRTSPPSSRWRLRETVEMGQCVAAAAPSPSSPSPVGDDDEKPSSRSRDFSALPKPLTTKVIGASQNGSNVRVAYQGCPGAFGEAAALKAFPLCKSVPCEHFENAFQAVELCLADKAVLPIENSSDGSFHEILDLLMCHKLHIIGEVHLAVDHCLMALPGSKKEDLKRVLSHPQALGECNDALSKLDVARESFVDAASAAQFIALKGIKDTGVIASARAAELYGLNILEHGMQDFHTNITRFVILAREPIIPTTDRPFKTIIALTLEGGPWVLFKALTVFALRELEITKIESRPLRERPLRVVYDLNHGAMKYFDYLFYVDIEGSLAQRSVQNALAALQGYVTSLRILGSFPVDTSL